MAEPMRMRVSMVGDKVDVKVLMEHVMETGLRKDAKGNPVAAHFIQNVQVAHNDVIVLAAQWGTGVAKNPFLHFRFKGGKPGDKISTTWTDNKGDKRTDQATIAAA